MPLLGEDTFSKMRTWLALRIEQGRQWLIARRDPLTWTTLRAKLTLLKLPSTYAGRLAVLAGIVLLLLLVLPWYARGHKDEKGVVTYPNAALINPILGGLGALFLISAAIRQAQTASRRHDAQTKADLQRRITETFTKAVEQLASEKMEARLGGIYTLERLASETLTGAAREGTGPDLYWTVMETLAAFVRERARWNEPSAPPGMAAESALWQSGTRSNEAPRQSRPPTDIAAVLDVIRRRPEVGRERERSRGWHLDLQRADLRGANLGLMHLEGAYLDGAHLEGAGLFLAHLEGAFLREVHLEGAYLVAAHLKGAFLNGAHLEGANLRNAQFDGAALSRAIADAKTRLSNWVARPAGWPPETPE
jgi:hypothetical protein